MTKLSKGGKGKVGPNTKQKGGITKARVTVSPEIKSPSDTTIYTPAVRKANPANLTQQLNMPQILSPNIRVTTPSPNMGGNKDNELLNKILHFVESIRMHDENEESNVERAEPQDMDRIPGYTEAKRIAEKSILDAEQFKATIIEPEPGKSPEMNFVNAREDIGSGLSDDNFFHLTCHVESSLIVKIEKGEFVELEKLVPKDKRQKSDDNHLEWIHQDGGTFLAPVVDRANKITNFRKWDQAFRVYATIYCRANPSRAKEIWQYVLVINTAATTFMWDNVYEYDVTFRHLMPFNLNRSWAVTYNQMWNLCIHARHYPKSQ